MARMLDLTGMKFGRLTAVRRVIDPTRKGVFWECRCDCQATKVVMASWLTTGNTKSCGCFRSEMMREAGKTRNLRHGEGSNGKESPEYRTWSSMLSRCNNPNHRGYKDYGARGIKVCDRWTLYENFLADMGRRPSDTHSLDRIDNNAGYSPENCRWATYQQQNNNQRSRTTERQLVAGKLLEREGRTQTVLAWCRELGLKLVTCRARLKSGMALEDAVFLPLQRPGRKSRAYRNQTEPS